MAQKKRKQKQLQKGSDAEAPLVSVLIRTCQRPQLLRRALDSVAAQTYPNIQAVVVEDGENRSQEMIEAEYAGLCCIYRATGKKVGRCAAGNLALALAEGKYLNFLDDDDFLFPDHIETLARRLEKSRKKAAYSTAEERPAGGRAFMPDRVRKKNVRCRQPFNRLLLYTENYIPIQSMMFHRSLYEQLGGFDLKLDALEDWDLWVRYSLHTDYLFVDKITSCYHTPYKREEKCRRSKELKKGLETLHNNFEVYGITLTVENVNQEMRYVIREYKNKGLLRYLRMFFRVVFLNER